MSDIRFIMADTLKEKPADSSKLGFGKIFTDYMFIMEYDEALGGWHDARIQPYQPLQMDPAASVLHYGQAIFEGMKAYRRGDTIRLFRPTENIKRMNVSAARMCMAKIDEDLFWEGLTRLVLLEKDWIPQEDGTSLYIRPFLIATQAQLGVHASTSYTFMIILSPVAAYYAAGLAPVSIYVEDEYVRAVRGGVGFAKVAGNYAASILAGDIAAKKGYSQVLWLDGVEKKYVEEVGSMNMFFVLDGKVITPPLLGSILPGITRASVLELAKYLGYETEEYRISVDELHDCAKNGRLSEAFGTGTAAVISPVGSFFYKGEDIVVGDGGMGPIARKLYDTLTGIQNGTVEDPFGWSVVISK